MEIIIQLQQGQIEGQVAEILRFQQLDDVTNRQLFPAEATNPKSHCITQISLAKLS